MPFESGKQKTGGRKKGVTNKTNLARAACDKAGVDPFGILAEFARSSTDKRLRYDAAKELAQYLEPKLRATELSSGDAEGFLVKILDFGNDKKT